MGEPPPRTLSLMREGVREDVEPSRGYLAPHAEPVGLVFDNLNG